VIPFRKPACWLEVSKRPKYPAIGHLHMRYVDYPVLETNTAKTIPEQKVSKLCSLPEFVTKIIGALFRPDLNTILQRLPNNKIPLHKLVSSRH
jgi:hypothetical protein